MQRTGGIRFALCSVAVVVLLLRCTNTPTPVDPCWSIALHGGAGTVDRDAPQSVRDEFNASLARALRKGANALGSGSSALDACEIVVVDLEDDPHFNAGRGAAFNAVGTHELDAAIMDGSTLRCGAVAGVTSVKNPIKLARAVMERTKHVLLAGRGADDFAATTGLELVPNSFFGTPHRRKMLEDSLRESAAPVPAKPDNAPATRDTAAAKRGTVGCVARDSLGRLAVATSTGGLTGKKLGRVGDSPIIGAGSYANAICAVSCTGSGEEFIRHSVARSIAARMEFGHESLVQATRHLVFDSLRPDDGGVIAIDAAGTIEMVYSTPGMYRGAADCNGRFEVSIFDERTTVPAPSGALIAIGGGLSDENTVVYRELCASSSAARIVIVTAASGSQEEAATEVREAISRHCPSASIEVVTRETSTDETVARFNNATALFFTGGDQKRIVARYRPAGVESAESRAMRALLLRGGVIAGTSAGDAMMGSLMFHGGSSEAALGVIGQPPTDDGDDETARVVVGPRFGLGMALEPWVLTDSHFFERNRIGRLIAALHKAQLDGGSPLGLGIGENAAVKFELAMSRATAIGGGASLLVDAREVRRDGGSLRGARVRVILDGDQIDFVLGAALVTPSAGPVEVVDAATNDAPPRVARSRAMLDFLRSAAASEGAVTLQLGGWRLEGRAAGAGWATIDIVVPSARKKTR